MYAMSQKFQIMSYIFLSMFACVLRYFMVLVQEMALKMDQGFLGEILAFFTPTANVQADKQKVFIEMQNIILDRCGGLMHCRFLFFFSG